MMRSHDSSASHDRVAGPLAAEQIPGALSTPHIKAIETTADAQRNSRKLATSTRIEGGREK